MGIYIKQCKVKLSENKACMRNSNDKVLDNQQTVHDLLNTNQTPVWNEKISFDKFPKTGIPIMNKDESLQASLVTVLFRLWYL